jgi:predicted nucleic acid-binding protein
MVARPGRYGRAARVSQADPPRAALDADIIYSRVLHELMGRVADDLRLLDLVWSEDLLAEARRSLVQKKNLTQEVATRWVNYLPESFPDGRTDLAGAAAVDIDALTDDPDDHHICALAIASRAAYLFTHDRGYLSEGLCAQGVVVVAPDPFLVDAFDADPAGFLEVIELQASGWAGGRPIGELLAAIERAGATAFAGRVRAALGLEHGAR